MGASPPSSTATPRSRCARRLPSNGRLRSSAAAAACESSTAKASSPKPPRRPLELELPAPPSWAEAEAASARYPGFDEHAFPRCFVCGPEREPGDGLRVFAGPLGDGRFAATWIPSEVSPSLVWAALDCPGAIAVGFPDRGETLLGRFAVEVDELPEPGERCVVLAWPLGEEGRKLYAGTALYGEDGRPLARARATWIAPNAAA